MPCPVDNLAGLLQPLRAMISAATLLKIALAALSGVALLYAL